MYSLNITDSNANRQIEPKWNYEYGELRGIQYRTTSNYTMIPRNRKEPLSSQKVLPNLSTIFNNQSATFDNMYALPRLRLMTMKTVLMFCSPFSKSILNLCNGIIKTLEEKICPFIISIALFNIKIKYKDLLWFTVNSLYPRVTCDTFELTTTIHLTLMTSIQVVKMPVITTNNSPSQDYTQ